jgi:hypothetical protein
MIKVMIFGLSHVFDDNYYSHIQTKLVDKVIALEGNFENFL